MVWLYNSIVRIRDSKKPAFNSSNALIRARDFVGALIGLVLLSPIFFVIIFRIKRDSEGPIIYRGRRMGKDGLEFAILKFRTMYERPESYSGPKVTANGDSRITPVGKWLRDTKLNELPQLWNVLIGEMSLVGPRPEDPDIVADWSDAAKREILSVRPGITSPASVVYRDEEALLQFGNVMELYLDEISPSKIRLDQLYIRYRSFWMDLDVLFWTVLVLLPKLGKYTPPERNLFVGPLSRLRHRIMGWFVLDLLIALLSMGISGLFWRSWGPFHVGVLRAFEISLVYAVIFSFVGWTLGIQRVDWDRAVAIDVMDIMASSILATALIVAVNMVLSLFPTQVILLAAIVAFFGFVSVRYRTRLITGLASRLAKARDVSGFIKERILVVGCGEAGQFTSMMFENMRAGANYSVVGFIDDDLYKIGTRIRGKDVLGDRHDLARIVREQDIGVIMFAIHNILEEDQKTILGICHGSKAKTYVVPDIFAQFEKVTNNRGDTQPLDQSKKMIPVADVRAWLNDLRETVNTEAKEYTTIVIDEFEERLESGD